MNLSRFSYFLPMEKQTDSVTIRLDPALKRAIQRYGSVRRIGVSGAVKLLVFEALKAQGQIVEPGTNDARLSVAVTGGSLTED